MWRFSHLQLSIRRAWPTAARYTPLTLLQDRLAARGRLSPSIFSHSTSLTTSRANPLIPVDPCPSLAPPAIPSPAASTRPAKGRSNAEAAATLPTSSFASPSSPSPSSPSPPLQAAHLHPRDELCLHAFADRDVIACMRVDHRLADWLWERWCATDDADTLQRVASELRALLSTAMACEEWAVYPVVRREAANGELLAQQLMKEHFVLKGALYKLEGLTVNDEGFGRYVSWTYSQHAQHAEREERELIPLLQRKSQEQLRLMAVEYHVARAMAPTRPSDRLYSKEAMQWVEAKLAESSDGGQEEKTTSRLLILIAQLANPLTPLALVTSLLSLLCCAVLCCALQSTSSWRAAPLSPSGCTSRCECSSIVTLIRCLRSCTSTIRCAYTPTPIFATTSTRR